MMLRARRGQRHRRCFGRTTVDGRAASGTIEVACLPPVSAFDLSAQTKTRLTRLGSARPYVCWINLRACPEDQARYREREQE